MLAVTVRTPYGRFDVVFNHACIELPPDVPLAHRVVHPVTAASRRPRDEGW
jgi:hypothetical protein